MLYKHCPNQFVDETVADLDRWKLVIPEADRERVLFECHNPPRAGHLGAEKTGFRVVQTYFWPSISKDVAKYVKQCLDCQLHKVSQQAPAGLMGKREADGPWLVIASDVMGPFPPSKSQYRYVLVFQDLFTKFIEVRPLRRANAQSISKAFDELVVFRWGCPKYLVTDKPYRKSEPHSKNYDVDICERGSP